MTFLHLHLTEGTGAAVDVKNSALQSSEGALEVLPVFPRGNNECGRHRCLKVKGQKWLQNESQLYRPEFWCLLKQLFFVVVFFSLSKLTDNL